MLDVRPTLGRAFLPEESQPGKERVVLLSQGVWQRRFGAGPNLLGQSVTLYVVSQDAGDSHWLNLNDHEMANNKKLPPASAGLMCTYAIFLGFR